MQNGYAPVSHPAYQPVNLFAAGPQPGLPMQQQMPPPPQMQPTPAPQRFANPNVESNNPHVFMAVYSGIAVFEMMCRGIGVMRRRADNYMNATQILKVAGVDKGKRTRILEKDIVNAGPYEKVQGGYGRFQGTWIPFERAKELAEQYSVAHLLAPIFEYGNAGMPNGQTNDLLYPAAQGLGRTTADKRPAASTSTSEDPSRKRDRELDLDLQEGKRIRLDGHPMDASTSSRPAGLRLREASKPARSTGSIVDDPMKSEHHRHILHSIFMNDNLQNVDLATVFPPDLDPDTPIDDHLHTALHWAASLARMTLIRPLLAFGADMHRGNDVGETALVRAVLTTNHYDLDSFGCLLDFLAPSLRTVDSLDRTVLHHITLIAGVKGRFDSARYYMQSVLEYVARKEDGDFYELVNAQDKNGDTALNIAARVGSKGLVKMLMEVGADRYRPNKLGLKPGDFGVDNQVMADGDRQEVLQALQASSSRSVGPQTKSQDIIANLVNIVNGLGGDFQKELAQKNEAIERTQNQLQAATRDLTDQRQQMEYWRGRVSEIDQLQQKVQNLERALAEESVFDWTGRTEINGAPSQDPSFNLAYANPEPLNVQVGEPQVPTFNSPEALVRLRTMMMWYQRIGDLLAQRTERSRNSSIELEAKYRRIVASYCGIPLENVDAMLDQLLQAIQSDGAGLDVGRVANFLSKVKSSS